MLNYLKTSLTNTVTYTPPVIVINLLIAFVLGVILAYNYKQNHRGISYSQSFFLTLVLLSVTVSVVMMVIGNNLARAFGLVGALSIIRFRTVVKDTKDTAYVFFALAIGMASGTSSYFIATIATLVFIVFDRTLTKMNLGSIRKHDYIVRFNFRPKTQTDDAFKEVLQSKTDYSYLVGINVLDENIIEHSYNIRLKKNITPDSFVYDFGKVNGVDNVGIISSKMDIEY